MLDTEDLTANDYCYPVEGPTVNWAAGETKELNWDLSDGDCGAYATISPYTVLNVRAVTWSDADGCKEWASPAVPYMTYDDDGDGDADRAEKI